MVDKEKRELKNKKETKKMINIDNNVLDQLSQNFKEYIKVNYQRLDL